MAKKILNHYRFKSRPNPLKSELEIGTILCGITIPHCTIELSPQNFARESTQSWIKNVIQPRMDPRGTLVIIVLPEQEGSPFHE